MAENNEYFLTLPAFEEASQKVKEVTVPTELIYSDYFSNQSGNKVYLKPENMQRTGAYKIRGAYYRISKLSDEERARGVVTASAGNHAQGVALAAQQFGCKATIVMPTTTPLIKVNRTKALGAEVVLFGDVYDEACQKALRLAEEEGSTFVHPFDDLTVATGQGTIAMEIVKELPLVDYILVLTILRVERTVCNVRCRCSRGAVLADHLFYHFFCDKSGSEYNRSESRNINDR